MLSEKDRNILQKFSKVQNACAQLKNAIAVIYENALSNEELTSMSGGSDTEKSVATSAASMISTYLANARASVDIIKICDYYKYEADISNKIPYFKQPIISNSDLEALIFMDKNLTKSRDTKTNDALKFFGETELQALISYSLSKKFPSSNKQSLENLKEYLLSDKNLKDWARDMTILEGVPSLATKVNPKITKQEIENIQVDLFKAYIGALILDRGYLGLEDVYRWMEKLTFTKIQLLKFSNLRGLYANDLKTQLEQFMIGNKSGQSLQFINSNEGGIHRVKVTLGQTVLGQAEALTEDLANKKAASNILSNTSLLSKYSVHHESIPIYSVAKEEPIKKKQVANNTKSDIFEKSSQNDKILQPPNHETSAMNIQPSQVSAATNKNVAHVANQQPLLTADALNEQIMSQLTSKMASMVSQLTSQILQNNNMSLSTEQITKELTSSSIKSTSQPETIVQEEPSKIIVPKNIVATEDKNTKFEKESAANSSNTTVNGSAEIAQIPKEEEITSNVNNTSPLVPKIKNTRNVLTNSLEKKKNASTTDSTTQNNGDSKTAKSLLKKEIPPVPKVGVSLKDLPKIPPKQFASSETKNNSHTESIVNDQFQNKDNTQRSQETRTEKPEDIESGNTTVLSEESIRRINKIQSTNPIKLPLKTLCDKGAKAKVYEIFGRFKMYPDYTTIQLGVNDFYSICSIRGEEDSFMGEGRGTSKKIAEQIAATEALENERLKELVETRKKQVEKLLGCNIEDLEQSDSDAAIDEVDTYKHFQPQEDKQELPVFDTCDKSSMTRLYAIMGQYRLYPKYESVQEAHNIFHSICKVKGTAVVLSEGRGTTKKISQQIAAENALEGDVLAELLSEIALEE